jgi:hypothetical protein
LSVATTDPVTLGTTPWQLASAEVVDGEGQVVITGGVASTTVTLKLQLAVPAEQVTTVVPTGNAVPDAGVQVMVPQFPVVEGFG